MNQPIQILLASDSKFFLEGIRKILENEGGVKIVAEALDREEIERCLITKKPQLLFLDNRTLNLVIHELLNLTNKNGLNFKVILLHNKAEELDLPNILCITKETNSLELIKAIKETQNEDDSLSLEKDIPEALPILYSPDIIELSEVVSTRENKRKKLVRDQSTEQEPSLPQKELSKLGNIRSPGISGRRAKEHLNREMELPEREFNPDETGVAEDRKLLSPLHKPSLPEPWSGRHSPSFFRESGRAIMLFMLMAGFIYIGSAYFDGRSAFSGFMEEVIFPLTDSSIKSDIETNLWKQGYSDIRISVIDGRAVLSGKVSAEEDRHVIRDTVNSVGGVRAVENNIAVEKIISDAEIASEMAKALDDKGHKNIGVTVTNRSAILSGTLSSQEERQAVHDIAMNIEGVDTIEDNLEITPKKVRPIAKKKKTIKREEPLNEDSFTILKKAQSKSEWRIRK